MDLSSGTEEETYDRRTITEKDKGRLHLRSEKPPKRQSTSQLVTLKQRERATLRRVVEDSQIGSGLKLPVAGV